jgi:hypothetical protein
MEGHMSMHEPNRQRLPVESQAWLAIYSGAAYLVFDVLATLVSVPYLALTYPLTRERHVRICCLLERRRQRQQWTAPLV